MARTILGQLRRLILSQAHPIMKRRMNQRKLLYSDNRPNLTGKRRSHWTNGIITWIMSRSIIAQLRSLLMEGLASALGVPWVLKAHEAPIAQVNSQIRLRLPSLNLWCRVIVKIRPLQSQQLKRCLTFWKRLMTRPIIAKLKIKSHLTFLQQIYTWNQNK